MQLVVLNKSGVHVTLKRKASIYLDVTNLDRYLKYRLDWGLLNIFPIFIEPNQSSSIPSTKYNNPRKTRSS